MKKAVIFKNTIEMVPVDKLKPRVVNPNFVSEQIQQSIEDDIRKNGFYGAILIDKDYNITDGEHRWRALKKLGATEVPCIKDKDLTEITSKIQTIRMNRERGYLTPIETGTILQQLAKNVPADVLTKLVSMPANEMHVLMNLHYDPIHDHEKTTKKALTWADVEKYAMKVANQLRNLRVTEVVAVSRGGLVPARLIADRLDISNISLANSKIKANSLVIDDIYDTGKTYKEVMSKQKNCVVATLLLRTGQKPPTNLVYGAVTEDDSYITFPWDRHEFKRSLKSK